MEASALRCIPRDVSVLEDSEELIQSAIWARQKEAFGWSARAFELSPADSGDEKDARAHTPVYILVLIRSLPGGLGLAYIPFAPDLKQISALRHSLENRNMQLSPAVLLEYVGKAVQKQVPSLFCVRFDLNWSLNPGFPGTLAGRSLAPKTSVRASSEVSSDSSSGASSESSSNVEAALTFTRPDGWSYPEIPWENTGLEQSVLKKSLADIQPPDTVILTIGNSPDTAGTGSRKDHDPGEQELLATMKSKTRYNIRLAGKKHVEIRRIEREDFSVPGDLKKWYELYRITEERNRIGVHGYEYYAGLFRRTRDEQCILYLAEHEGDLLAGIIVSRKGNLARYLYGASSNVKRNLMPAYALQWRAIRDMRSAGCRFYDFFGIPPYGEKGHPMFGLYQFKTGFGGEAVHTPGSWDLPVRPVLYRLYRWAEFLRMYYLRVLRKR